MEQPIRPDGRHFYLYAKNRYQRSGSLMEDVRRLVAEYVGSDPQSLTDGDVLRVFWEVVYPEIDKLPYRREKLLEIMARLLGNLQLVSVADLIALMLPILTTVRIKEGGRVLLDLGEPDPTILPLRE
jgi:hypothetical protein